MGKMVELCSADWHQGKCRLSKDIEGWGCKLLTCLPDEIPVSKKERDLMFSKVYSYAENIGVTKCKHFCPAIIETSLKDDEMMGQMTLLNQPTRADLLSEIFEEIYN